MRDTFEYPSARFPPTNLLRSYESGETAENLALPLIRVRAEIWGVQPRIFTIHSTPRSFFFASTLRDHYVVGLHLSRYARGCCCFTLVRRLAIHAFQGLGLCSGVTRFIRKHHARLEQLIVQKPYALREIVSVVESVVERLLHRHHREFKITP